MEIIPSAGRFSLLPPPSPTGWFGVDGGVGVARCVGHARPPPPEEAAQDAALEGLQQGALP